MTLGDLVVTSKLTVMSQPAWWVPAHGHRHGAAIFIRHVNPELKPEALSNFVFSGRFLSEQDVFISMS